MMIHEVLIVLAGGMMNEQRLSAETRSRVLRAAKIFRANRYHAVIMSGGRSLLQRNPSKTSIAEAMRRAAVRVGIPTQHIIVEDHSKDTLGNAIATKNIVQDHGWTHCTIVTNDFHLPRTRYIFRKVFGKKYTLTFRSAPCMLSPEEMQTALKRERRLLIGTRIALGWVPSGSLLVIATLLKLGHLAYDHSRIIKSVAKGVSTR